MPATLTAPHPKPQIQTQTQTPNPNPNPNPDPNQARVFIFDHTLRESGNTDLNATAGGSAAPVPRVHCDYTEGGAPRRLQQLGEEGIFSKLRGRTLTPAEAAALAAGRFAFINVWRSIDEEHPVLRPPPYTCHGCTCYDHTYYGHTYYGCTYYVQVLQQPLAVCDERSVPEADRFLYELRFPDR